MPIRWTFRRRAHWPDLRQSRLRLARALRRKRRRIKRRSRLLYCLALAFCVIVALCTVGPVPRMLVLRQLNGLMANVEFTADSIRLSRDGTFIARGLAGRLVGEAAADLPPPARELLTVEEAELVLSWPDWQPWRASLAEVKLLRPMLTISQGDGDGATNLGRANAGARPTVGPSATVGEILAQVARVKLPRVIVANAFVRLGEHQQLPPGGTQADAELPRFAIVAQVRARGYFVPADRDSRSFALKVRQTGGDSMGLGGEALQVSGRWLPEAREAEVQMSAIDLGRITPEKLPTAFRDPWQRLNMRGRVESTVMRITPAGAEIDMQLASVRLAVPIAAARADLAVSRPPVMEDVRGTLRLMYTPGGQGVVTARDGGSRRSGIEAVLDGNLEDLRAMVVFSSDGLSLDAPYVAQIVARGFKVEREPRLLWMTPDLVRDQLTEFSTPTAEVDALINIAKSAPTPERPSGIRISGSMSFINGMASYALFPYPLIDLSGTVDFDDDVVLIRGIRGRSASGAGVLIQGSFNQTAAMEIEVTLADIPFDDEVRSALDASPAKPLLKELFSPSRAEQLKLVGLMPEGAEPGGTIDWIKMRFVRPTSGKPIFERSVTIRMAEARLLPDAFPLPLYGNNVEIKMEDGRVTLKGPRLNTYTGGEVAVDVDLVLDEDALFGRPGARKPLPTVRAVAKNVRVDDSVRLAIDVASGLEDAGLESAEPVQTGDGEALTAGEALRLIGFDGMINASIVLKAHATLPRLEHVLELSITEGSALPKMNIDGAGEQSLGAAVTQISGELRLTPEAIEILSLAGQLRVQRGEFAALSTESDGVFLMAGVFPLAAGADGKVPLPQADFSLSEFNLAAPVEQILRPFDSRSADAIAAVRSRAVFTGLMDLDASIAPDVSEERRTARVSLVMRNLERVRINLAEGELRLDQDSGALTLSGLVAGKDDQVKTQTATLLLSDFEAEVSFRPWEQMESDLVGRLGGSGALEVSFGAMDDEPTTAGDGPVARDGPVRADGRLTRVLDRTSLTLRDGRFGSPLLRSLAAALGGEAIAEMLRAADLRGEFAAQVRIEGQRNAEPGAPLLPTVIIAPVWAALKRGEFEVLLPRIDGSVTVTSDGGSIDGLLIDGGKWELGIDGAWYDYNDDQGRAISTFKCDLNGMADDLTPSLRAMFPEGTRRALLDLKLGVPGGLSLTGGRLEVSWQANAPERGTATSFFGPFRFVDLMANPGVNVRECSGQLTVSVADELDSSRPSVQITLEDGAMLAAGLPITSATALLESGAATGQFVLKAVEGDCLGGRITGSAVLNAEANSAGEGKVASSDPIAAAGNGAAEGFAATFSFAGVQLGAAVEALAASYRDIQDTEGAPAEKPKSGLNISPDARITGRFSLVGGFGGAANQTGEGSVRVAGGRIIDVPLLVPMLRLSNLQLPAEQPLDYFQADFTLRDQTIRFQRLAALSASLAVLGEGTMKLPSFGLDLSIASRGRDVRIPLLTGLLESLRDEIITARVSGTLTDPQLSTETLSGTRQLFSALLGGGTGANSASEQLREVERQARRSEQGGVVLSPLDRQREAGAAGEAEPDSEEAEGLR